LPALPLMLRPLIIRGVFFSPFALFGRARSLFCVGPMDRQWSWSVVSQ
jgi:hypothetical protein